MSTPQGPQPPHGAPQQPAEQPAWGQQQASGGWGAPPEDEQRRREETRVVPRSTWDAPETSEVPQTGAPAEGEGGEVNLAKPDTGQQSGDTTQVVRGEQQAWNRDETRVVRQPGDEQGEPTQVWGPGDQAQQAAPYASPQQHYGTQPQAGQPGQQQAAAQAASPYAPQGQQQYGQPGGPYGQAPGYGQQQGQQYGAQPGQPAYGQQPTQQFGQPQFGQQGQQGQWQPGQQPYGQGPYGQQQAGQQSPWAGQQAGWGQGGPGQQQWGAGHAAPPGSSAPRGSKNRMPLIIGGVAAVVVLAVGVLGFVTPGFFNTRVLDAAAVQDGVRTILTQDYGLEVESVTCPEGTEVQTDVTFQCTAVVDGQQVAVPIKITSTDGNYEVGRPA